MRSDDGILAEAMVAEVNPGGAEKRDPVLAQFIELRKYIEHSHDGLSGRVDGLSGRVDGLSGRLEKVETRLARLERKVDAGFDRLGRKLDALASARRVTPRRRKP